MKITNNIMIKLDENITQPSNADTVNSTPDY
jgi:hypothetical protein